MPTDGNVSVEFHEIFMKLKQELFNRWKIYKRVLRSAPATQDLNYAIITFYPVRSRLLFTWLIIHFSYGAIRSGYGQHFGPQGGQDSGFPSPRSALGYPFPAMQNSYSSYHLGGYAPPCASPPKDGTLLWLIDIYE